MTIQRNENFHFSPPLHKHRTPRDKSLVKKISYYVYFYVHDIVNAT